MICDRFVVATIIGWTSPSNTCSDKAGSHSNVYKMPKAGHSRHTSFFSFERISTVTILRVIKPSLDSVSAAGAVKSTGRAAVGGGVLTLL